MRTFHFKARNIGDEKYLTYTMGEECELDEDILDYCQDNAPEELVEILYEEDDDYDYLTYEVTGKQSLEEHLQSEQSSESVLKLVRNIAQGMISLKEQAIPLSYVILNRNFIFLDNVEAFTIKFLCVPIESKGALAQEFKAFVRQLLANMQYDVEEDLNYVGKLLTYINGSNFNLRGLIGLAEALMEEIGISYEEAGAIDADGVEVVSAQETDSPAEDIGDIMNSLADDEPLPEIGDDEDESTEDEGTQDADEELDSILPTGMKMSDTEEENSGEDETAKEEAVEEAEAEKTEEAESEEAEEAESETAEEAESETAEEAESETAEEAKPEQAAEKTEKAATAEEASDKLQLKTQQKESDINVIKERIKELVGEVPSAKTSIVPPRNIQTLDELDNYLDSKPPVVKRNVVKVNRAAIIQQTEAEMEAEAADAQGAEKTAESSIGQTEQIAVPVIEDIYDDMNIESKDDKKEEKKAKSTSILNKSVGDLVKEAVGSVTTPSVPKALPFLIRVSTEERIMLNKTTFKIGKATRGVDYTVGGNGAISRQHAIIVQRDGVCYIKDNKSTNHTYVNGKALDEGAEEILTHDSVIRLADEEFTFKIR